MEGTPTLLYTVMVTPLANDAQVRYHLDSICPPAFVTYIKIVILKNHHHSHYGVNSTFINHITDLRLKFHEIACSKMI